MFLNTFVSVLFPFFSLNYPHFFDCSVALCGLYSLPAFFFLMWVLWHKVFWFKQDSDDDDWFPEDIHEAFKELRKRKVFDVEDMYTIADAWGWTWERDLKNRPPRRWSQEWEVELAVKVMQKASDFLCVLWLQVVIVFACLFKLFII